MKKLITILAVLLSLLAKGQTYDPTTGTVTNKPLGLNAAAATDSRSYFYSTSTFSWRPYQSRAEILSYLNLAKYRTGQFDIIMDSASQRWVLYFRNGTTDNDLVYKIPIGNDQWKLIGNLGTVDVTNFLGTRDNIPLTFKVNNFQSGRIDNTNANTFFGYRAGGLITSANNTAIGYGSLLANSSGGGNTSVGTQSLFSSTFGNNNTSVGYNALSNNTAGGSNTVIGYNTALGITTGSFNTVVGANVTGLSASLSNNIIIADGQGNKRLTVDDAGTSVLVSTTALGLPTGNTAQRPSSPAAGYLRYNTDSVAKETYNGTIWVKDGSGGGGGSGTVANVATGLFLSGGPITTTGTIIADSASMAGYFLRRKDSSIYWPKYRADTSILAIYNALAGKQATGNYITATTGDVVATGPGSVSATIQANAVTTTKIINSAVTLPKLANGTANSLIGYNGSGVPSVITAGSNITIAAGVISAAGGVSTAVDSLKESGDSVFAYKTGSPFFQYNDFKLNVSLAGDSIFMSGDSYTASQGASTGAGYSNLFPPQVGKYRNNLAVGGTGAKVAISNVNIALPGYSNYSTVTGMFGFNDLRRSGYNVKTLNKIQNAWTGILASAYLSDVAIPASSASTTGTWTVQDIGTALGGKSTKMGGTAKYAQSIGATMSWTFTGTNVFVSTVAYDGVLLTGGIAKVEIDGVPVDTIDTNGQTDGISDGFSNNVQMIYAVGYWDLPYKSHTITLTTLTTNTFYVDYFGVLNGISNAPPVYMSLIPKMNSGSYAIGAGTTPPTNLGSVAVFNSGDSVIKLAFTPFFSRRYPVQLVDVNKYFNPQDLSQLDADSVHPSDTGYAKILQAFMAVTEFSAYNGVATRDRVSYVNMSQARRIIFGEMTPNLLTDIGGVTYEAGIPRMFISNPSAPLGKKGLRFYVDNTGKAVIGGYDQGPNIEQDYFYMYPGTVKADSIVSKTLLRSKALQSDSALILKNMRVGNATMNLLVHANDSVTYQIPSSTFATPQQISDSLNANTFEIDNPNLGDTLFVPLTANSARIKSLIAGTGVTFGINDSTFTINSTAGSVAGSNTQVQYNNSGAFGAEAAFAYDQSTNRLTAGEVTINGSGVDRIFISGNNTGTMNTIHSPNLTVEAMTNNDATTSGSGTITNAVGFNYFGLPTLTATNSSITYTDVSNVKIEEPVAGTNITIDRPRSLYAKGIAYLAIMANEPVETSSSSFNIGKTGIVVFNGSTGTGTLPSLATYKGAVYFVKNAGSGNLTIASSGSDNLYDTSSVTSIIIAPGAARIISASTSFWYVQ